MQICLFLWLMLLITGDSQAQSTNLTLSAPTNYDISHKVNLSNIQIGKPFEVSYTMPAQIMQIIDIGTNIIAEGDTDIDLTNATATRLDLLVTSYSIQPYAMPSLLITALDIQSNTNIFYTPSFVIPISNDIVTNTNLILADIEPIYYVWDHLWTIGIVFLLLMILGVYFFPKIIKSREKEEEEIVIDPFGEVQRKLDILKDQSTKLTEESYKEFFVELSETVREFLSHTMIPLALEMPTREILLHIKESKLDGELQEMITLILRNTDRAKYAKQIFPEERIAEVIDDSYKVVRLIKRKKEREQADELRKS